MSSSAGLMWPASFEGSENVHEPHCTIMFLGEASDLRVEPQYILTALWEHLDAPGEIPVTGLEVFGGGEHEEVYVAVLDTSVLVKVQSDIEQSLLETLGIENKSSFPDYRPHVTLGPVADFEAEPTPPAVVTLDSAQVWRGGRHFSAVR